MQLQNSTVHVFCIKWSLALSTLLRPFALTVYISITMRLFCFCALHSLTIHRRSPIKFRSVCAHFLLRVGSPFSHHSSGIVEHFRDCNSVHSNINVIQCTICVDSYQILTWNVILNWHVIENDEEYIITCLCMETIFHFITFHIYV